MLKSIHKKATGKAVKATAMPDLLTTFSSEQLAQAITAKRTGMKLRLVDVAQALSISKQTLVKIEKGDTKVNFINLLKVMEYLGLSFQITTDSFTSTQTDNMIRGHDDDWY